MNDKQDYCQWKGCKCNSDIVYLGVGLCDKHWIIISEMPTKDAWKKLGITEKDNKINDK